MVKLQELSKGITFEDCADEILNMDEQKLLDLTKEKYNICDDEFNGYHDSRFDVVCTYMIYLSKETEDDESKQLVYYMEKSKIESHPPLNKSKKRKESSIFKDLFSFKGEIDNKKFSILIWSIIILRSICMSIIRYCGRNSVEFINEIGLFILAISLILLQFSMIAVIIKRLRTKKESLWKILIMLIPLVNLIFIGGLTGRTTAEICKDLEKNSKNNKVSPIKYELRNRYMELNLFGLQNETYIDDLPAYIYY